MNDPKTTDAISRSAESEIYPIDGEALFNAVQNLKRYDIRRNMFEEIAFMHMFKDQDVLNTILSAERLDVAPVVHARWIDESKEFEDFVIHSCRCSACGKNPLYRRDVDYTKTHTEVNFRYDQSNFCPNCGARMDGDENG